jgi:hypothetical protein
VVAVTAPVTAVTTPVNDRGGIEGSDHASDRIDRASDRSGGSAANRSGSGEGEGRGKALRHPPKALEAVARLPHLPREAEAAKLALRAIRNRVIAGLGIRARGPATGVPRRTLLPASPGLYGSRLAYSARMGLRPLRRRIEMHFGTGVGRHRLGASRHHLRDSDETRIEADVARDLKDSLRPSTLSRRVRQQDSLYQ